MSNPIVTCENCGMERNLLEAPECPMCRAKLPGEGQYAHLMKKRVDRGEKTYKVEYSGLGRPRKKYTCPRCGHFGFVRRWEGSQGAECEECGKRIY